MERTIKFDPEMHQNNVFEAFSEFVEQYEYEYDAIAKDPPKDLGASERTAWILQNKRKMFQGKFAGLFTFSNVCLLFLMFVYIYNNLFTFFRNVWN